MPARVVSPQSYPDAPDSRHYFPRGPVFNKSFPSPSGGDPGRRKPGGHMRRPIRPGFAVLLPCLAAGALAAPPARAAEAPIAATVETTLTTGGRQIRQLA